MLWFVVYPDDPIDFRISTGIQCLLIFIPMRYSLIIIEKPLHYSACAPPSVLWISILLWSIAIIDSFISSFAFTSVLAVVSVFLISSPIVLQSFALPSANRYGGTTWVNNIQSLESWTPQSATLSALTVRPILLSINISFGGESLRFGCRFFCYSIPCDTGYSFAVFFVIYQTDYTDPDDMQMVWTANREHLVQDNATLGLTSSGNLVLKDVDGSLVWSTNTSSKYFQGLMIEDRGNLVLFNSSNGTMWQSFDHPTDTLLQGQKLKVDQKFIANISLTNASQGFYYGTLKIDYFAMYTARAAAQMCWNINPTMPFPAVLAVNLQPLSSTSSRYRLKTLTTVNSQTISHLLQCPQ